MSAAEEVQFPLKVMMIKESNKVLYTEVDGDFADVLLSFLTLPLGTIVRLLIKHYGDNTPIVGSLNSLYAGLLNLDSSHFWTEAGKLMLLNPRNSLGTECRRLKLHIDDTPPIQYFVCGNSMCVSIYYDVKCLCGNSTNEKACKDLDVESQSGDESVFTVKTLSFLLTDHLQILPNSPTSLLRILKLNGIEDIGVLEERTLIVGLKEIFELLKGSLVSKTPLTDIILGNSSATAAFERRRNLPASVKYEPDALPQTPTSKNTSSDSKKITVKALVQKSTNRVLFAQTWQDFIDFLFSLLTIPLAGVQFLLGSNTCLGSIYNLYRSISDLETDRYIKSRETIAGLLEPQIPPYYLSSYQIFSLRQQWPPVSHGRSRRGRGGSFVSTLSSFMCTGMNTIDPKGQDSFVKGPTIFMVTDDLVVSAPSSTSFISTLNQVKIPLSDVEEHELNIGMEEALSILQASLTSASALTSGFKPFLKRRPKQEI